jgi:hypothetical protein
MQLADNQLNTNIGTAFSEIHSEWAVGSAAGNTRRMANAKKSKVEMR